MWGDKGSGGLLWFMIIIIIKVLFMFIIRGMVVDWVIIL